MPSPNSTEENGPGLAFSPSVSNSPSLADCDAADIPAPNAKKYADIFNADALFERLQQHQGQ